MVAIGLISYLTAITILLPSLVCWPVEVYSSWARVLSKVYGHCNNIFLYTSTFSWLYDSAVRRIITTYQYGQYNRFVVLAPYITYGAPLCKCDTAHVYLKWLRYCTDKELLIWLDQGIVSKAMQRYIAVLLIATAKCYWKYFIGGLKHETSIKADSTSIPRSYPFSPLITLHNSKCQ